MKAREFLTDEQKEFIREAAGKKYISEIARKLKVPASRVHKFLVANNIDFKGVPGYQRSERFFPEGCFNPHERENWLV